jgi:hypothetical protein
VQGYMRARAGGHRSAPPSHCRQRRRLMLSGCLHAAAAAVDLVVVIIAGVSLLTMMTLQTVTIVRVLFFKSVDRPSALRRQSPRARAPCNPVDRRQLPNQCCRRTSSIDVKCSRPTHRVAGIPYAYPPSSLLPSVASLTDSPASRVCIAWHQLAINISCVNVSRRPAGRATVCRSVRQSCLHLPLISSSTCSPVGFDRPMHSGRCSRLLPFQPNAPSDRTSLGHGTDGPQQPGVIGLTPSASAIVVVVVVVGGGGGIGLR